MGERPDWDALIAAARRSVAKKMRAYVYVGGPLDGCVARQEGRKGETVYRDENGTPMRVGWANTRRAAIQGGYYARRYGATKYSPLGEYHWRALYVDDEGR